MSKSSSTILGLLLIAFTSAISALAQEGGQPVAILVVDVFEVSGDPAPLPPAESTCVFTIDGQDSYRWEGFADGLTPILHPAADTHGEQVHGVIKGLLDTQFGSGTSFTSSAPSLSEDWLRDMITWNNDQVYLVGIDTNAYTSSLMVDRIQATIEALYVEESVTNFVINMSFAIIPCSAFPLDGFRHYTDAFKAEEFQSLQGTCIDIARSLIPDDDRFSLLPDYITDETTCEDLAILADNPTPPEEDQQIAEQISKLLLEVFKEPDFQQVRELVYFGFQRPQIPLILQAAYPTVDAPDLSGDPFTTFLENDGLQQFCTGVNENINCVAVAASGNDGRNFPYAPASLSSVISASAEYSRMPVCDPTDLTALETQLTKLANENSSDTLEPADVSGIVFELTHPRTNDGEVEMDGVLDEPISLLLPCLRFWGTSFAAPRLSYEMAIHFLNGGTAEECFGQAPVALTMRTFTSEPPLNYADGASGIWENLDFQAAKDKYCDNF